MIQKFNVRSVVFAVFGVSVLIYSQAICLGQVWVTQYPVVREVYSPIVYNPAPQISMWRPVVVVAPPVYAAPTTAYYSYYSASAPVCGCATERTYRQQSNRPIASAAEAPATPRLQPTAEHYSAGPQSDTKYSVFASGKMIYLADQRNGRLYEFDPTVDPTGHQWRPVIDAIGP